jgi:hypothetical protein
MKRLLTSIVAALVLAGGLAHGIGLITQSGPKLFIVESSGGGGGTVVADLQASRTSCTAPCAIHFSATGTTSSDATVDEFSEIGYSFIAGDSGSGTYAETGASRNEQRGGPVWGHIYETAGTYTAKVRARDSSGGANDGDNDQDEVTITVAAADTTFSGSSSICVDSGAGTGWGPTGCSYTSSMPSSLTTSNRRYLIRRGSTVGGWTYGRLVQNVFVMAHGSGADPIVTGEIQLPRDETVSTDNVGVWPTNIVIQGLEIRAGISIEQSGGRHILIKDNTFPADAINANTYIDSGHALDYYTTGDGSPPPSPWTLADYHFPRNVFVVGNEMIGDGVNTAQFFGAAVESALFDNEIYYVQAEAHNLRLTMGYKTWIGHNNLRSRSGDGARHALKVHGTGLNTLTDPGSFGSGGFVVEWIVVADNLIGDPTNNNSWLVSIRPESEGHVNGQRNIILERNEFDPTGASLEVQALVLNFWMRANTRTDAGSVRTEFITDPSGSGYSPSLDPFSGNYNVSANDLTYLDPT